ncbi:MAG: ATP-binding protein, partial [Steroidobacteraceae bacterium]
MTFRSRLFWIFTVALVSSVTAVAAGVAITSRRAFEQESTRRTDALVEQFRREFSRRGAEVALRIKNIADDELTVDMATKLSLPQADASLYVHDASGPAQSHALDFLDYLAGDGNVISSYEWPERFGYKEDWLAQPEDWAARGAFLRREETPTGGTLALMAVSAIHMNEKTFYVAGGVRLGQEFLASLALPAGMRALLYQNLDSSFSSQDLLDASGSFAQADKLAPLIERVRRQNAEVLEAVHWSPRAADAELFHAIPLDGRQGELLGVLLVGSSQREIAELEQRIVLLAIVVALGGLLLGSLVSWWAARRVTRPIELLSAGARAVARGNWNTRVEVSSRDEVGELARAFNQMTEQLFEQRNRLVQTERVAAWRELARRLAHELKNPLFPLQITVENLRRAREHHPGEFDEVFEESTGTLLEEIETLKSIITRFSDFSRMPPPELRPVNVNDLVRGVVKLFEAQFSAVGRPPISPEVYLDEHAPVIHADATLLHKAVENLVLNAMDAMPAGGTLTIRTASRGEGVHLEISDTGAGLTREECQRLFTPYYTTKQHGTGLGLAIVQSVVSDHGGAITVESELGAGTTFRIDLPGRPPLRPPEPLPHAMHRESRPIRSVVAPQPEAAVEPEPKVAAEPSAPAEGPQTSAEEIRVEASAEPVVSATDAPEAPREPEPVPSKPARLAGRKTFRLFSWISQEPPQAVEAGETTSQPEAPSAASHETTAAIAEPPGQAVTAESAEKTPEHPTGAEV